jgi:solute carrier family 66, member 2
MQTDDFHQLTTGISSKNVDIIFYMYRVLEWVASGAIVFGGVVPYVPQYLDIRRTRNAEGFSTFVCLTLLIANTLRILFWFGHPFELPLLVQSLVMTVAMLAMVQLCTEVRQDTEIVRSKQRYLTDFDLSYFWQWTDFLSYVQFLILFTLTSAGITYVFSNSYIFVETLGLCAVLSEAMLGVPQFYRNFQKRSTEGMSVSMVLLWTAGDVFKTIYFVVRNAPMQFWLCGMLQISLDIAILCQVLFYRR